MKLLITLSCFLGLQCAFASAIDDVVSKFDRHGLWLNGMFIPIIEPETINENVLAAKILTSYRKSSKELQILEKDDISALKTGISGMKAMHVRVIRTSMYPPPAKEIPEEWVIVYQFQGGTTGWWSRIYTIEEKKTPNKAVEPTIIRVTDRAYARSAPRMIAAHF
jgi:hypothetical protein